MPFFMSVLLHLQNKLVKHENKPMQGMRFILFLWAETNSIQYQTWRLQFSHLAGHIAIYTQEHQNCVSDVSTIHSTAWTMWHLARLIHWDLISWYGAVFEKPTYGDLNLVAISKPNLTNTALRPWNHVPRNCNKIHMIFLVSLFAVGVCCFFGSVGE